MNGGSAAQSEMLCIHKKLSCMENAQAEGKVFMICTVCLWLLNICEQGPEFLKNKNEKCNTT